MTAGYVLVIGEALVDLVSGTDEHREPVYRPRYGGSPLNVAVGVRRLGTPVEFVGPIADDTFGKQLRSYLDNESVGVSHAPTTPLGTCLAVSTTRDGHTSYEYYGAAHAMLAVDAVDAALIGSAVAIHAGSTAFLGEPVYTSTLAAIRTAKTFTTIDPNPRPHLIDDHPGYLSGVEDAIKHADLVKMSGDDIRYLYPGSRLADAARHVHELGHATVIITQAEHDTLLLLDESIISVPVSPTDAVDPTGAGDSFMACVLADVARLGPPTTADDWQRRIHRANVAAGITCTRIGGAEAMPTSLELATQGAETVQ